MENTYKDTTQAFNKLKNAGNELKNNVMTIFKRDDNYIYILISLTIVFLILFVLLTWINYTLSLKDKGCTSIASIYDDHNTYRTKTFIRGGVNYNNPQYNLTFNNDKYDSNSKSKFNNFYVKAAYNCMCADGYKNNWVNECALTKCIEQGARFLDFEVYSLHFQPVVAASTANNYNIKETYNFEYLSTVFETLYNSAFNENITQAYNDPMIIHLRLMTENTEIYNLIATYIKTHLDNNSSNYLLPKSLTIGDPNYDHNNILKAQVKTFAKKFIIIVYQSESVINQSNLKNYVNLRSGSAYCRLLRYQSIFSAGENNKLLIDETKEKYTIILPDVENSLENYDYYKPLTNGCQIIAMKFQNMDENLIKYNDFFINEESGGYSFVLKPPQLINTIAETIGTTSSQIELTSSGIPGVILIYNRSSIDAIKYKLYKDSDTDTDVMSGRVNRIIGNNNQVEKIHLEGSMTAPSYFIAFTNYNGVSLENNKLQIMASGTEKSRRSLNTDRPLDYDNTNKKFEFTPAKNKATTDIKLTINEL